MALGVEDTVVLGVAEFFELVLLGVVVALGLFVLLGVLVTFGLLVPPGVSFDFSSASILS